MENFNPGKYLDFPTNIIEAYTFHDCILVKCHGAHYIIVPFRDEFLKIRITRKKYEKILARNEENKTKTKVDYTT